MQDRLSGLQTYPAIESQSKIIAICRCSNLILLAYTKSNSHIEDSHKQIVSKNLGLLEEILLLKSCAENP
jgi:hypothetical protein